MLPDWSSHAYLNDVRGDHRATRVTFGLSVLLAQSQSRSSSGNTLQPCTKFDF